MSIKVLVRQIKHSTLNNLGGTMGEREVKHSLIAPARSRTQPTASSDIVSAEDPMI